MKRWTPWILTLALAPWLSLATWFALEWAGVTVETGIGWAAVVLAPMIGALGGVVRQPWFGAVLGCTLGLLLLPLGEAVIFRRVSGWLSVTTAETISALAVLAVALLIAHLTTPRKR